MNSRFSVAIFGGIGAGKKTLSTKLYRQFTPFQNRKIEIFPVSNSGENIPEQKIDYKVFIDRPFDLLLQKYVVGLPIRELIDKHLLDKKINDFRIFHQKNVFPEKFSADFLIHDLENDERIHFLMQEILEKWKKSITATSSEEESPDVQIYLDRSIQKAHPGKISGNLYIN